MTGFDENFIGCKRKNDSRNYSNTLLLTFFASSKMMVIWVKLFTKTTEDVSPKQTKKEKVQAQVVLPSICE